ncbi:Do family serine endopeptidase [Methylobacterium sp. SyP6R]|uniref:Do family serine endopeptidase n=1 Tax=Methylobacterium sp. SyP6R TaxID=2718876 RepID=UPI001F02978C|nr:Do family serine endopeptidase [Methylobacterium sp. SyP6R]MCF4125169.1 Do family serine endopeptidase [Methylobacterium sp. SyP6R]
MSQTTETSRETRREPSRFHRKALASVAAVTLVATGALGTAILPSSTPAYAQALPQTPITTTEHPPGSFAPIVNRVKPGVVSVKVKLKDDASDDEEGGGQPNLQNVPPQLRDFFRRFGEGGPGGMQRPQRHGGGAAQGSGFFISADGYVVTNNHVVNNAKSVEVTLDDGRTLPAKIIGTDPKTDLALLKVTDGAPFPYVKLSHGAPQVGDWVVAIGNPFGLGGTVTAGIVSARGRDIGAGPYDDFLQIDAPINKGNSGGPTFDVKGEVVGVNTAIASPSGGNVGLAFAIPSETVQAVVDQLRADGKVARGYLGLQIQPVTKDIADSLGLDKAKGALVNSAQDGTPAAKAGLKAGDVVQAVNGEPVTDARELSRKIASLKPGTKVDLTYVRSGKTETAQVTLGTLPNDTKVASANDNGGSRGDSQPRLGLSLAPAAQVGAGQEGVAVVGVDPDGPAAAKGIQEGDVILDVGGQPVSTLSDVAGRIRAAESDGRKAVLMRIKNDKGTRFVAIGLQTKNG